MLTLNFIRSRGYEYCCEDGKGGSIYIRNNENDITYKTKQQKPLRKRWYEFPFMVLYVWAKHPRHSAVKICIIRCNKLSKNGIIEIEF